MVELRLCHAPALLPLVEGLERLLGTADLHLFGVDKGKIHLFGVVDGRAFVGI